MLRQLIETMELPPARKDLTRLENLKWLQKNMQVRNGDHTDYKAAFKRLNFILRVNGY